MDIETASNGRLHMIAWGKNKKYASQSFGTLEEMIKEFINEDWPGCDCGGCKKMFKSLPNHKIINIKGKE